MCKLIDRLKLFTKKYYCYLAAFILPTLLLLVVYVLRGVYPFGHGSVLTLDLNAQYIYYYEAFRDAFFEGRSLLYSFSRTLGGEMAGIFAYYLASPFNVVLLLFPKKLITEAILTIILLKVGTSGLTFAIYLKSVKKSANITVLMFSVMYALMSYMVVQTMNPMWLDGLIFLPIIILGTERLVNGNKYGLLVISLTAMFIANFYIGYMTGIFVFVYYLYALFGTAEKRSFKEVMKKSALFAGSALIAVCCSMWLLLPTYASLQMGKFGFSLPDFAPSQKAGFFDIITKALPLSYDSVNYGGYPFIFCGTLILPLIIFYFWSRNRPVREKIASLSFILFFIACFSISTADIALHGFQHPVWLDFRYSFILSFFLLMLANKAYISMDGIDRGVFIKGGLALFFIIALIGKLQYEFIKPEYTIWIGYTCVGAYSLLLYGIKTGTAALSHTSDIIGRKRLRIPKSTILSIILLAVVSAEMFLNARTMIEGAHKEVYYSDRSSYRDYFERLYPLVDFIRHEDKGFYRSETVIRRTVNDPMALGIYGVSHSSSTLNSKVIDMLFKLGLCSREHWTRYKGTTLLTDSVLGMKYVISENPPNGIYMPLFNKDGLTVYHNPFALPVAFAASRETAGLKLDSNDPFINQNALLSSLLGEPYKEYFKLVDIKEIVFENIAATEQDGVVSYQAIEPAINAHIEYVLDTAGGNEMYMYLYSQYPRKVNLWKDKEFLDTFFDYESICIMPLGANPGKQTISLITTPTEGEYYLNNNMFYYIDLPLFKSDMAKLDNDGTIVEKISESHLHISTLTGDNEMLFTTIPYENGWQAAVDGKSVRIIKTLDSLMAIELEPGRHEIELSFTPYGLVEGSAVSALAVIIFIISLLYTRKFGIFAPPAAKQVSSDENTAIR